MPKMLFVEEMATTTTVIVCVVSLPRVTEEVSYLSSVSFGV